MKDWQVRGVMTSFLGLSDRVLAEVLAALPLEQAVRVSRLGSSRLGGEWGVSSRPWVLDRVSHVTFTTVLKAYQMGGKIREKYCGKNFLKKLRGKIFVQTTKLREEKHMRDCLELVYQVPGNLIIHAEGVEDTTKSTYWVYNFRSAFFEFLYNIKNRDSVRYMNLTNLCYIWPSEIFSNLVLEYFCFTNVCLHLVHYCPARINRRKVFDVMRAVAKPIELDAATIREVRKKMQDRDTENPWGPRGKWRKTTWELYGITELEWTGVRRDQLCY